jgi:SAM-dependent methyltransferase
MEKNYTLLYTQHEKAHWWFTARKEILETVITKIIKKKKYSLPLNILNVGPAGGTTSIMLENFGKVKSLEFDEDLFDYCKNEQKLDVDKGSIIVLPYHDESFDMACAFDVIEHVEDDKKAMDELKRVVKKNGLILVTVPAFQFLWSYHDEVNNHFRRYSKPGINQLAKSSGLSVFYSTYFNFFLFFPILAVRAVGRLKSINNYKSDFDEFQINKISNKILHSIFKTEKKIIFPLKFPFGVSVLSAFTK